MIKQLGRLYLGTKNRQLPHTFKEGYRLLGHVPRFTSSMPKPTSPIGSMRGFYGGYGGLSHKMVSSQWPLPRLCSHKGTKLVRLFSKVVVNPKPEHVEQAYIDHFQSKLDALMKENPTEFQLYQSLPSGQELDGIIPIIHVGKAVQINPLYQKLTLDERAFRWAQEMGLDQTRTIPLSKLMGLDTPLKTYFDTHTEYTIDTRYGPSIEVPYLLPTNPDLLAALTAPHLDKRGYDAYRKLLAWLYLHDDLVVDKKRTGPPNQRLSETNRDCAIHQRLLHDYQCIMNGERPQPHSALEKSLVNAFADMWRSYDGYDRDKMTVEITAYLAHGTRELEYSQQVLEHKIDPKKPAPQYPYTSENDYFEI